MKTVGSLILAWIMAWPQAGFASVAVYLVSTDGVVIAADSRAVHSDGTSDDTECKVRALNNNTAFVAIGTSGHNGRDASGPAWSSYAIARSAWRSSTASKPTSLQALTETAAKGWAGKMAALLKNQTWLKGAGKPDAQYPGNAGEAIFLTTKGSELAGEQALITLDLSLYERTGKINLSSSTDPIVMKDGNGGSIGLGQVANEYMTLSSERAREFMPSFLKQPDPIRAALAKKLVELTIELHPNKKFLGPPVDELFLRRRKGIEWLYKKANCQNSDE